MSDKNSGGSTTGAMLGNTLWILQVIFVVLKLTSLIDWSWWTVLIPLYIIAGFVILGIIATLIAASIATRNARLNAFATPRGRSK